jgi:hypothetical protein
VRQFQHFYRYLCGVGPQFRPSPAYRVGLDKVPAPDFSACAVQQNDRHIPAVDDALSNFPVPEPEDIGVGDAAS